MAGADRNLMAGRPEILWPLFGALESLSGIGPKTAAALHKAGVQTPRDLLFSLPHSVIDRRVQDAARGVPGAVVTTQVSVLRHEPAPNRSRPHRVLVEDADGPLVLVFFRARGEWLERQLPVGGARIISGKLDLFDGTRQIAHPDYILPLDDADKLPAFEPIYPLTEGVTQKQMAKAITAARTLLPGLAEWADRELVAREDWPQWGEALHISHCPQDTFSLSPEAAARQRLAYDELFAHQLTLALARSTRRRQAGRSTVGAGARQRAVLHALPYDLTGAQTRAVAEITADMAEPQRMNRLLQGDVGAGKTLVAFMALLAAVEAGGQGALMAPTEILVRQHLEGLEDLAAAAGVRLGLLTGRDKGAARAEKLAALAAGEIDILIGTHALFQPDVVFQDLRLAVIDEQHRFGVAQRMQLGDKGGAVDVLVMTATPIPRSLALAQYGDMDVSILDEKPPGRKPVTTALISVRRLDEVTARLQAAIAQGRQVYWVCPLVEDSEVSQKTSAESRFKALRKVLGEGAVALVHGQMPPAEKDAAMAEFVSGRAAVLVATTVIEVGVNVPNASIMVIEEAEGFGLAQLHQLRGRVGRGSAQSTCLLMYREPLSESGKRRLEIMRETEDGFRISEEDLALRGAGDVIGTAQSGLPHFRIADLERQSGLMQLAQQDARLLLELDPKLQSPRGQAARVLLWLMGQDEAIKMISIG